MLLLCFGCLRLICWERRHHYQPSKPELQLLCRGAVSDWGPGLRPLHALLRPVVCGMSVCTCMHHKPKLSMCPCWLRSWSRCYTNMSSEGMSVHTYLEMWLYQVLGSAHVLAIPIKAMPMVCYIEILSWTCSICRQQAAVRCCMCSCRKYMLYLIHF